ncbi:hypothetical protein ACFQJD_17000 [Haloplanus sp. GCM10025708]|uniref:hypothetical protein n=1 Tax=Haloferacaceae TaxID=1644056 RepID=UPI0036148F20
MVSPQSVVTGGFILLVSAPLLLFPRKSARIRYRHARNPEPTEKGVREARLTGGVIFLTGVFVLLYY